MAFSAALFPVIKQERSIFRLTISGQLFNFLIEAEGLLAHVALAFSHLSIPTSFHIMLQEELRMLKRTAHADS